MKRMPCLARLPPLKRPGSCQKMTIYPLFPPEKGLKPGKNALADSSLQMFLKVCRTLATDFRVFPKACRTPATDFQMFLKACRTPAADFQMLLKACCNPATEIFGVNNILKNNHTHFKFHIYDNIN